MANKPIPTLKKRSAVVPPEAMSVFVAGDDAGSTSAAVSPVSLVAPISSEATEVSKAAGGRQKSAPQTKTTSPKLATNNGRKLTARRDGSEVRKVTAYLDADLDMKLSLYAVKNGLGRTDVLAQALERFLAGS